MEKILLMNKRGYACRMEDVFLMGDRDIRSQIALSPSLSATFRLSSPLLIHRSFFPADVRKIGKNLRFNFVLWPTCTIFANV
jgi:hypothetical protein